MLGLEYRVFPVSWDWDGSVVEWSRSAEGAEIEMCGVAEYLAAVIADCGSVEVTDKPGNVQDGGDGILIVPDDKDCYARLMLVV